MTDLFTETASTAVFSPDRLYRYTLTRQWGARHAPVARFIGLNPSTADETADDPTIRRCIGFAKREGCGGLVMLNLFAWRSTDPLGLTSPACRAAGGPVGPENDEHLLAAASPLWPGPVIACWGAFGRLDGRGARVARMLTDSGARLVCFGRTAGGEPRHPLYLRADTALEAL